MIAIGRIGMKTRKTYEKPVLVRRETLPFIVAGSAID
jgi:hypothetical protein